MTKCVCQNCKMYLSKQQNILINIYKCIYQNEIYLSKIAKCIFVNEKICYTRIFSVHHNFAGEAREKGRGAK